MNDLTAAEKVALREAMGGLLDVERDERIDLPLAEQVRLLAGWACSSKPADFRRTVPVQATDHDILITGALVKLVSMVLDPDGPADPVARKVTRTAVMLAATDEIEALVAEAVTAETERCAALVDDYEDSLRPEYPDAARLARHIAAAIRGGTDG